MLKTRNYSAWRKQKTSLSRKKFEVPVLYGVHVISYTKNEKAKALADTTEREFSSYYRNEVVEETIDERYDHYNEYSEKCPQSGILQWKIKNKLKK